MKHIVFVLGSYYPNYSAVGKCLGNIADVLEESYKITVISMKTFVGQAENDRFRQQKIIRISTKYQEKRMINEGKLKKAKGVQRKIFLFKRFLLRTEGMIRTLLSTKTIDKAWVNAYLKALNGIHEPIDFIIPTCSPIESIEASLEYKKNHNNVELMPYLFDLFASNSNLNRFKLNVILKKKKNKLVEETLLKDSFKVFHVPNWTRYLNQNFPQYTFKTVEVEHPLLINKEELKNSNEMRKEIHLVYTGILDEKNRKPDFVLSVLSKIKSKDIIVDFYSFGSGNIKVEEAENKQTNIISHGKVSSSDAEKARYQADILLSIGNTDVSQIPSKLFEYMAIGKPILHFATTNKDPSIKILEDYPLKKVLIKGEKINYEEILLFINKNKDKSIPFSNIVNNYYKATPEFIANEIKNSIESL